MYAVYYIDPHGRKRFYAGVRWTSDLADAIHYQSESYARFMVSHFRSVIAHVWEFDPAILTDTQTEAV